MKLLDSEQQLSKTNILMLLDSARWAIGIAWATKKSIILQLLFITILLSLVPVMLALSLRELVNEITAVLSAGEGMTSGILFWLGFTFAVTLIDVIGGFANKYLLQRLNDELNLSITTDVLKHASSLDVTHFEDPGFQDVLERVQQNIAGRFSLFVNKILTVLNNILQMVSLTAILIFIEPLITLVLFGVAVPYLFFQWRLAKSRYKEQFYRTTKMRWTRYFVTHLTNQDMVPEIKLLRLGPLFIEKFRALMAEFRDQNKRIYGRIFTGSSLFAALSSLAFFLTFVRVTFRVLDGSLTIGDVAIYGGATARLRNALENAIVGLTEALEQTLHISNLRHFLSLESNLDTKTGLTPATTQGKIRFDNVTFAYPGTKRPVLENVSFTIKPGETVAIVGRNGAGKTTLVKLMARLYQPTEGAILFDERDLRQLSLDYLHKQVAFVFQHFGRYEATVAENIAYGSWESLLDDSEAIEQIAKTAGVHWMIQQMPEQYDTSLGRMFGEYTLSGGQWQRIAIARAFARKATLLILDEPTSNLDAAAEFRIFSNFRELAEGRTTILISHRFSTVSMADRIIVLDKGQIVESGTHVELLALEGHYARLYDLHSRQMEAHNGRIPEKL